MSNPFDDIDRAIREAKAQQEAADAATETMVHLIVGRLRHASGYRGVEALKRIKLQLRNFNAKTGRWSD